MVYTLHLHQGNLNISQQCSCSQQCSMTLFFTITLIYFYWKSYGKRDRYIWRDSFYSMQLNCSLQLMLNKARVMPQDLHQGEAKCLNHCWILPMVYSSIMLNLEPEPWFNLNHSNTDLDIPRSLNHSIHCPTTTPWFINQNHNPCTEFQILRSEKKMIFIHKYIPVTAQSLTLRIPVKHLWLSTCSYKCYNS